MASSAFQRDVDGLVAVIMTNKDEWEKRNDALMRLQALVEDNRSQTALFNQELWRSLKEPLLYTLGDLRSSLVREACKLLEMLSEAAGDHMRPLLRELLPVLLSTVGSANGVIKDYTDNCMQHIIAHTKFPRQIKDVAQDAQHSKSAPLREALAFYLSLMLQQWPASVMESQAQVLETVLAALLEDASPKAREHARKAFVSFRSHWPQRAERLRSCLQPRSAKLLDEEAGPPPAAAGNGSGGSGNNGVGTPSSSATTPGKAGAARIPGSGSLSAKRPMTATGIPRLGSGREQQGIGSGLPRPASAGERVIRGGGKTVSRTAAANGGIVGARSRAGTEDTERSGGGAAADTSLLTSRGSAYSVFSSGSAAAASGGLFASAGSFSAVKAGPSSPPEGAGRAGVRNDNGIALGTSAGKAAGGNSAASRRYDDAAAAATGTPGSPASPGDGGRGSLPPTVLPKLGQRVRHKGEPGIVRYVGEADFASGWWVGIELDLPRGKNDGRVAGSERRYFTCAAMHGLFAKAGAVEIDDKVASNGGGGGGASCFRDATAESFGGASGAAAAGAAAVAAEEGDWRQAAAELLRCHKADLAELMHLAEKEVAVVASLEARLSSEGGEEDIAGVGIKDYLAVLSEILDHREAAVGAAQKRLSVVRTRHKAALR